MSNYLLISGARERENGFELGEGKYYEQAKLLKLDLDTSKVSTIKEKSDGGTHYPDEHPNLQYTSMCLDGDVLWLPTDTEIFKLSYPSLEVLTVISEPYFHNIHSVNVFDKKVYVTSTGLDLVAVYDEDGTLLEMFNTEGKALWHRFSAEEDYRLIHSTRPHDCHPNFVFKWQDEAWVTRCRQQDAVCLTNVEKKMELTDPLNRISVHDGMLFGDLIYFTSVDGMIIVMDPTTQKIVEQFNLVKELNKGELGWARGLSISEDGIAYVGFSKIRRTKMVEKLAWLALGQLNKMRYIPASVVAYDLKNRKVIKQYIVPMEEIDAVYGIELANA